MINVSVHLNPATKAAFDESLKQYIRLVKQDAADVLNKRGHRLRMTLFSLFRDVAWGGPGMVRKGKGAGSRRLALVRREAYGRFRAGRGMLVRSRSLMPRYQSRVRKADRAGRPTSTWQQLVEQEILRRAAGIGVLAVTFLLKRGRYRSKAPRYLVENRTSMGSTMLRVTFTQSRFTLEGMTAGLAKIAAKYGILNRAVAMETADMQQYIHRKLNQSARVAFRSP